MNHLNTVLIEGNLTKDPMPIGENSANPGCKFIIANNRYRLRNGEWDKETTFFPVVVFGRIGDACIRTLKRGRGVRVCGRLKQGSSNLKNESLNIRDTTFILAEHVEFQPERTVANAGAPVGNGNAAGGGASATGSTSGAVAGAGGYNAGGGAGGASATGAAAPSSNGGAATPESTQNWVTTGGNPPTNYSQVQGRMFTPASGQNVTNVQAVQAVQTNAPVTEPVIEQGPEAFTQSAETNDWDNSVPDKAPTEAEMPIGNIETQVSAEEISEAGKSEDDFDAAENSEAGFNDNEPDF